MKSFIGFAILLSAVAVSGCNSSPSDKLADKVENAADMRADNMEMNADALRNAAGTLDDRAAAARDNGDSRADAIRAADRNVSAMDQTQRDAIIANDAAAVR